ncbi:DUF4259 domain-containing protein [Micromonospora sp. RHAY321]|uniref:DUF4259 domain-containing protein n=1 Tax=Micromonospora sp. RHAY321 TaxID=2944807 RepID=UPI00207D3624|nr:DUF4259 domain-containing protein [Micromonospora sp. RHAY321]MCO1595546.1 DUF4259 domain-containing protein [Micromonospora sp. RHAY321]
MGTFGTGPFSSDGALDFVEELAEKPPEHHLDALRHMFAYVLANRDLLWREFFPDQVVAAAALVAAALPGGEHLQAELSDETDMALLPASASDLATPALEALLFVAGPDGPWHQGWTTEAHRLDARRTINDLDAILSAAVSPDVSPMSRD